MFFFSSAFLGCFEVSAEAWKTTGLTVALHFKHSKKVFGSLENSEKNIYILAIIYT
jgi:hypothetical protein